MRVLAADQLDDAVALLDAGGVLGLPTDTVYGLATRLDEAAVGALFAAKGRPDEVPVAVLCADAAAARTLVQGLGALAEALAEARWPGPLTIVVAAPPALARAVRSSGTVGLRVPSDPTCRALLARSGPLAVTSANRHGDPPATTAAAVARLEGVAGVLDDGPRDGAVSTVVDATGPVLRVLREGALGARELDEVVSRARGVPPAP